MNQFSRSELLLGDNAIQILAHARAAVFGLGGVGANAAEALARAGIGALDLIDDDVVCVTNINRQLIALHSTVGQKKVDAMRARVLDINPTCRVTTHQIFLNSQTADQFDFSIYDYVIDAVDTVTAKLLLIEMCRDAGTPIVACMGTGNKLDPTRFEVADIYETSVCPLAAVMRRELRKRGIAGQKVVYSKEVPVKPIETEQTSCKYHCVCPPGTQRKCTVRRQVPGSVSFVPGVAGMILAGEAIKDIIKKENQNLA
ncbi:MAG: tRNA threonylcarbamoyladenosine dehydratase [Oscillospiraceae bacterium]|jgi:tRNA A37 threonylcarbamoyladenosine dehydratase|nr:tRNA threonylcarbamoyladenosine dehydratase [Oscillospiraceae bacterium]